MIRILACCLVIATPVMARPTLVCQVTARVPFTTAVRYGFDSTRIFTQTAGLLQERTSSTAILRLWTVLSDTPEQLVAIDPARSLTLTIDQGLTFAEAGLQVERRGYCRLNDLP